MQAKLIFTVCASRGCSPGLGQDSSTTRREDLAEKSRREPENRRKPSKCQVLCSFHQLSLVRIRRVMALSLLSLILVLSSVPAVLGAQGVTVPGCANGTFAEAEGQPSQPQGCTAVPKLHWRRKGGENRAAFIIQERNRAKAEQCRVTKEGVPA